MAVIEFYAYLPPIQSAIMLDGAGDNLQIKLNIPLRMSPDAIRLAGMTGKKLKITVDELTDIDYETEKGATGTPSKLDSRRTDLRHDQ
jgi:hypothetical protein